MQATRKTFGATAIRAYVQTRRNTRAKKFWRGEDNPPKSLTFTYSAKENAGKLFENIDKYGRNPLFFAPNELQKGINLWFSAIKNFNKVGPQGLRRAAQLVANHMVDTIKKHIKSGRSEQGVMPPLSKTGTTGKDGQRNMAGNYAYRKNKMYGNKPILAATGAMIDSLIGRWKALR
jgi:hypothetical protein